MQTYQAESLVEAVELAVRFKKAGRYNWFRGQRQSWRPTPSLHRLSAAARTDVIERLTRFRLWIEHTPGMEEMRDGITPTLVVAQHYGIPTNLLDFTANPGVAGYFASSSGKRQFRGKRKSCIYCLHLDHLLNVWREIRECLPHYPEIRFITESVPNLWRLEAQESAFLECVKNWDRVYPMDRIEFPISPAPSYPSKEMVLPERKSQLEILLDEFFTADRFHGFHELVTQAFPEAKVLQLRTPPNGYEADYFVPTGLPERSDWKPERLKRWVTTPHESFKRTALGEIALELDLQESPSDLITNVTYAIRRALESNPKLRLQSVRWSLVTSKLPRRLAIALDWLWSGLRRYPYKNEEIAEAVGLCFGLYTAGLGNAQSSTARRTIVERILGPCVLVQFSSWSGCPTDSFASQQQLLSAVRADLKRFLLREHHRFILHIPPLLQLCTNPRRLFVFRKFARVFSTQIAPIQVLTNEKGACHFSPGRLEGFGLK